MIHECSDQISAILIIGLLGEDLQSAYQIFDVLTQEFVQLRKIFMLSRCFYLITRSRRDPSPLVLAKSFDLSRVLTPAFLQKRSRTMLPLLHLSDIFAQILRDLKVHEYCRNLERKRLICAKCYEKQRIRDDCSRLNSPIKCH